MTDQGNKMHLFDLKTPLGGLMTFYGLVLFIYGVSSDPSMYERSLGHNVNLWWGLVMLLAGGGTLLWGIWEKKRT